MPAPKNGLRASTDFIERGPAVGQKYGFGIGPGSTLGASVVTQQPGGLSVLPPSPDGHYSPGILSPAQQGLLGAAELRAMASAMHDSQDAYSFSNMGSPAVSPKDASMAVHAGRSLGQRSGESGAAAGAAVVAEASAGNGAFIHLGQATTMAGSTAFSGRNVDLAYGPGSGQRSSSPAAADRQGANSQYSTYQGASYPKAEYFRPPPSTPMQQQPAAAAAVPLLPRPAGPPAHAAASPTPLATPTGTPAHAASTTNTPSRGSAPAARTHPQHTDGASAIAGDRSSPEDSEPSFSIYRGPRIPSHISSSGTAPAGAPAAATAAPAPAAHHTPAGPTASSAAESSPAAPATAPQDAVTAARPASTRAAGGASEELRRQRSSNSTAPAPTAAGAAVGPEPARPAHRALAAAGPRPSSTIGGSGGSNMRNGAQKKEARRAELFDEEDPAAVLEQSLEVLCEVEGLMREAAGMGPDDALEGAPPELTARIPEELLGALEDTLEVIMMAREEMAARRAASGREASTRGHCGSGGGGGPRLARTASGHSNGSAASGSRAGDGGSSARGLGARDGWDNSLGRDTGGRGSTASRRASITSQPDGPYGASHRTSSSASSTPRKAPTPSASGTDHPGHRDDHANDHPARHDGNGQALDDESSASRADDPGRGRVYRSDRPTSATTTPRDAYGHSHGDANGSGPGSSSGGSRRGRQQAAGAEASYASSATSAAVTARRAGDSGWQDAQRRAWHKEAPQLDWMERKRQKAAEERRRREEQVAADLRFLEQVRARTSTVQQQHEQLLAQAEQSVQAARSAKASAQAQQRWLEYQEQLADRHRLQQAGVTGALVVGAGHAFYSYRR